MKNILSRNELVEIIELLERSIKFASGGPNQSLFEDLTAKKDELTHRLHTYNDLNQHLECDTCKTEKNHFICTLRVVDNDNFETTEIKINEQYKIISKTDYLFRSQGNIHLLFSCASGHFFIKSFDGTKDNIIYNGNPLMNDLVEYLNTLSSNSRELFTDFNFVLLGHIESFFKNKQEEFNNENYI